MPLGSPLGEEDGPWKNVVMEGGSYGGWDYHMQLTLFLFLDGLGTMEKQSEKIDREKCTQLMELKKGLNIEWVACDSLVCESLVSQCAGRILVSQTSFSFATLKLRKHEKTCR